MRVLAVMHARYAYRARNIRNTPVVNIDKQSERLLAMRRLVRSLQVRVVGWACTYAGAATTTMVACMCHHVTSHHVHRTS